MLIQILAPKISQLTVDTNLRVNESILVTEGGTQDICVILANYEKTRERDIQVEVLVLSNDITSGMCTHALYLPLQESLLHF